MEIQAQKSGDNKWEALYENGREHSGLDAVEWAKDVEELGAGEILLTSVDFEGTALGFETELVRRYEYCFYSGYCLGWNGKT